MMEALNNQPDKAQAGDRRSAERTARRLIRQAVSMVVIGSTMTMGAIFLAHPLRPLVGIAGIALAVAAAFPLREGYEQRRRLRLFVLLRDSWNEELDDLPPVPPASPLRDALTATYASLHRLIRRP